MPVLVLIGGGWYAVHHATDGEELARLIEREAVRLLPSSPVEVGRVQIRPLERLGQAGIPQGRSRRSRS